MNKPRIGAALLAGLSLPALAGCTSNAPSQTKQEDRTIKVTSTDEECELSADEAPSGSLTYRVKNAGSEVTEFYLYAEDGKRIVAEVENVGPGLTRELVTRLAPGTYVTACKPGMSGDGIRADFTVSDSGDEGAASPTARQQMEAASQQYHGYVEGEVEQLLEGTREFVAAYTSGDDARARDLYPRVRVHWERIEPVAESFGDLDPLLDAREADLAPGQRWTGWHRIEKDLWPPTTGTENRPYVALTKPQRASYADRLLSDTETLHDRTERLGFTVDQIGNAAKSLLDEVATGKLTGEEEVWSHTDLYDFAANVDGARVAFEGLEPVLSRKDPELEEEIEEHFGDLQDLLDRHRVGGQGFVAYDKLSPGQVKQLSDAVNALSEPLSELTAAVTL